MSTVIFSWQGTPSFTNTENGVIWRGSRGQDMGSAPLIIGLEYPNMRVVVTSDDRNMNGTFDVLYTGAGSTVEMVYGGQVRNWPAEWIVAEARHENARLARQAWVHSDAGKISILSAVALWLQMPDDQKRNTVLRPCPGGYKRDWVPANWDGMVNPVAIYPLQDSTARVNFPKSWADGAVVVPSRDSLPADPMPYAEWKRLYFQDSPAQ